MEFVLKLWMPPPLSPFRFLYTPFHSSDRQSVQSPCMAIVKTNILHTVFAKWAIVVNGNVLHNIQGLMITFGCCVLCPIVLVYVNLPHFNQTVGVTCSIFLYDFRDWVDNQHILIIQHFIMVAMRLSDMLSVYAFVFYFFYRWILVWRVVWDEKRPTCVKKRSYQPIQVRNYPIHIP